jgi:hypothetical protein
MDRMAVKEDALNLAKKTWGGGNWNAYVGSGSTREERRERLADVPEEMRASVESHVRTVFKLRRGE